MNSSDTPDTDAASVSTAKWVEPPVCGSFARKLERERDQLRKACDELYGIPKEYLSWGPISTGEKYLKLYYDAKFALENAYNQLLHVKNK